MIGLFLAARRVLRSAEGSIFLIDAGVALVAVTVVILTLFDRTIIELSGMSAFLVAAYPVVFLGTSLAILFAAMALRGHSTGPGLSLMAFGSALVGIDWANWLSSASEGPPPVGTLFNYLWSTGVVLVGLGTVTWRFAPNREHLVDSLRLVRGLLPVGAVLALLSMLLLFETELDMITESLVALAVVLAMLRQGLLLIERERFAAREALVARDAAEQRDVAELALAAQRVSEERYRSTVEVFNKLGDQIGFAQDESGLLRATVAAMTRLAPSDAGELLIVSPSQDRLVVAHAWGPDPSEPGKELDQAPVRCLGIRRGSVYVVDDVNDDLMLACPAHPVDRGSMMCVPLMALGETVGVAHLERAEGGGFDVDTAREAARVAEQVALAITNVRMLQTLESMALTDQLTRLHNARFFDPFLDRELATAARDEEPLALIMIDLDEFKQFNDTHGHPSGDEALKTFSRALLSVARESDTVARYGGEEFVIAARHADLASGVDLAERIRQAVEGSPVELGPGRFARITASFGVSSTATTALIESPS